MSEELHPAHEVLVERIGQHAMDYTRAAKCTPVAYEQWVRFTECCTTLADSIIPAKGIKGVISQLRELTKAVEEEAASAIHQVANELERRMEEAQRKV